MDAAIQSDHDLCRDLCKPRMREVIKCGMSDPAGGQLLQGTQWAGHAWLLLVPGLVSLGVCKSDPGNNQIVAFCEQQVTEMADDN